VQYWYYAQLDALGRTGAAAPDVSPLAATRKVMADSAAWLKARRAG
ncbi:MAG: NADH:flavin oxidoreductase, partial [Halioglobus sp.]|nr:NADH:flavin oxidoreductase [Halioglobus sp.]